MFVEEKTQGEPQPVKVGTLKLSAAIRIGAALRPQGQRRLYRDGKSCALGAAIEGRGHDLKNVPWYDYQRILQDVWGKPIGDEIVERNDQLGHTREQIADWLESQGL